jgi:DNA-nicking Smr family endonuclease
VDQDIDFKKAMQGVRRLNKTETIIPVHPKPQSKRAIGAQIQDRASQSAFAVEDPSDRFVSADNIDQCNETGASYLFFLRNGLQKKILRNLKKGKHYPIQAIVDLHGLTRPILKNRSTGALQS